MEYLNQLKALQSILLSQETPHITQHKTCPVRNSEIYAQLFQQKLLIAPRKEYWTQQVTQCILNHPLGEQLALEGVAAQLNLTPRSLQRRLKQENTTFLEILNHIQFERAKLLLGSSNMNISEISDWLGYAEPSVFRRAFKRWTGQSPRDFLKDMKH